MQWRFVSSSVHTGLASAIVNGKLTASLVCIKFATPGHITGISVKHNICADRGAF